MEGYNPIAGNASNPAKALAPLVTRWMAAIKAAKAHKKKEFEDVAEEARNFFDGPNNYMWADMERQVKEQNDQGFLAGDSLLPQFRISVNRMFDAVAMFGPALYHQNPTVAVTPRPPLSVSIDTFFAHEPQATELLRMIPAMQAGQVADPRLMQMAIQLQEMYDNTVKETQAKVVVNNDHAVILEALSNYYQHEGNKQNEARLAITEAIITGLGCLEVRMETPPGGGPRVPACRFLSNRDLLLDPDACYWRDVSFMAIRRVAPANVVESRFNLPPGSFKGKIATNTSLAGVNPQSKSKDADGKITGVCHDLVEYYDVYSKNGAGQRLKLGETDRKLQGLESLGDFIYLAICPTCTYPLNLPDGVMVDEMGGIDEETLAKTAWPAPFWDDPAVDGGWPVAMLSFYNSPGKVWPISMCKACLPEMKFVNWCMSFLADGVAAGSKIYPAVMKSAAENIRAQLAQGSGPFTVIELEQITGKNINEIITFLKAPTFNIDIWNMLSQANLEIDKRLGLTELLYGLSSRQMRSAAEAQHKQSNVSIRPDDMASRVEDWLSITATRELQMLRWLGDFEDVQPIIGDVAAHVFVMQILTQDVSVLTREFTFRVQAGTARKPNKDTRIAQLGEIAQYLLPVTQSAMQLGVVAPFNAFIEDYGRAIDMDPSRYIISEEMQGQMMHMRMAMQGLLPEQLAAQQQSREQSRERKEPSE